MTFPTNLFTPRGAGLLLSGGLLAAAPARAQAPTDSLPVISRALARYQAQALQEKLFVHTDRRAYVCGDVLWFKVYAVDATSHRPLPLSKVAYVEVLDATQKPVLQAKVELREARGHGSFVLPAALASGGYTVRAYTSWMQNFGPEYYFHCPITVVNTLAAALPKAADTVRYDVQFFPEGGNLVRGLRSKVGFKITDAAGRGVPAEGAVLNRQGAEVARFSTLKFGMGQFELTPAEAGAAYTAVVRPAGQPPLRLALPAAYEQGYVLQLAAATPEQLTVQVQAQGRPDDEPVYLLAHVGTEVFATDVRRLANGQARFTIDRRRLPAGVAHFTVFDARQRPVCERLYFQRPTAGLALSASTDSRQYGPREKVQLTLAAAAPASAPASANVSVAVYRLDSLATGPAADIGSSLWLTSDLRGAIEQPEYYLRPASPETDAALDNLLLTQGWRRFRWDDVLAGTTALVHPPELNGPLVQGRLRHAATGAPAPHIGVYLAAPGPVPRLFSTLSRRDGGLLFEARELYGTYNLVAQPNLSRDSTYRVELLSPFSSAYAPYRVAAPQLTEAYRRDLTRRHLQMQTQLAYFADYRIPRPRPLPDSAAFYGRPDEHFRLDEYNRFKVMEEVLREYVPGVQVRARKNGYSLIVPDRQRSALFNENPLVLLDGMPVFDMNRAMKIDPLKVKTLDVITSSFLQGTLSYSGVVSYRTYRGDLGGFEPDARALVQEYEGLQQQREFYAPRYETDREKQSRLPDRRNLLYWHPDVALSRSASPLTFYTADEAGRYQVVVQGLAADGAAGSATYIFEVRPGVAQVR